MMEMGWDGTLRGIADHSTIDLGRLDQGNEIGYRSSSFPCLVILFDLNWVVT